MTPLQSAAHGRGEEPEGDDRDDETAGQRPGVGHEQDQHAGHDDAARQRDVSPHAPSLPRFGVRRYRRTIVKKAVRVLDLLPAMSTAPILRR